MKKDFNKTKKKKSILISLFPCQLSLEISKMSENDGVELLNLFESLEIKNKNQEVFFVNKLKEFISQVWFCFRDLKG